MSKSCKGLALELVKCLSESPCVKDEKRSFKDCAGEKSPQISSECIGLRETYFQCKRGQVDMRTRIRGNKGSSTKSDCWAAMREGTLSHQEFYAESIAFLELWNKLDTSRVFWQWEPRTDSMARGYLRLEDVPTTVASEGASDVDLCSNGSSCSIDSTDAAELAWDPVTSQQRARMTYHVVYSESYEVPVLFFRGYSPDGKLLSLPDLKIILATQALQFMEKSPWTFLSQEEHPFLHRPWFTLHPCGTSSMMAMIFKHEQRSLSKQCPIAGPGFRSSTPAAVHSPVSNARTDSSGHDFSRGKGASFGGGGIEGLKTETASLGGRYLSAWLSIVGPISRLEVPLELFKHRSV